MQMGVRPSARKGNLTIIEAIDTAANYYKHNESWITTRTKVGEEHVYTWVENRPSTIARAKAWGLQPHERKNMDKILRILGVTRATDIPKLVKPLNSWHLALARIVARTSTKPMSAKMSAAGNPSKLTQPPSENSGHARV